jgi:hypothetical protein
LLVGFCRERFLLVVFLSRFLVIFEGICGSFLSSFLRDFHR